MPPAAVTESGGRAARPPHRLVSLWVVVTALWTAATLLRVDRVWVPGTGWEHVLHGSWLWLSLGSPPLLFALVLAYVHQVIRFRRRSSRPVPPFGARRGNF